MPTNYYGGDQLEHVRRMSRMTNIARAMEASHPTPLGQLLAATEAGDDKRIKRLVREAREAHRPYSAKDLEGALHTAADNGHELCVAVFIDAGVSVDMTHAMAARGVASDGFTPLVMAAQNGHLHCVQMIVASKPSTLDHKTREGYTALWMAAQNGHPRVVEYLARQGANVNAATNDGCTALSIAVDLLESAPEQPHADCVKLLLAHHASPNSPRAYDGAVPLVMAAQHGRSKIVALLLDARADVHAVGDQGRMTALAFALARMDILKILKPQQYLKYKETADLLRVAGADVERAEREAAEFESRFRVHLFKRRLVRAACIGAACSFGLYFYRGITRWSLTVLWGAGAAALVMRLKVAMGFVAALIYLVYFDVQ